VAPHSRRFLALLVLVVFAGLGVLDGVYLTLAHVDYATGVEGVTGVCHSLTSAGCSVTAGRFGAIGPVPVATIGFAGSLSMAVLGLAALRRRRLERDPLRSVLLVMAGVAALASAVMGTLSFIEGSFCPFCGVWYVLNLVISFAAWWARNPGGWEGLVDDATGGAGFAAALVFGSALAAGVFVHHQRRDANLEAQRVELLEHASEFGEQLADEMLAGPRQQFDLTGFPRRGPETADLQIVEFGDLECPHCLTLFDTIEAFAREHPNRVAVYFAHFPLDSECNPEVDEVHRHACEAAWAAACAQEQGKFWEFVTFAFGNQTRLDDADLREHAQQAGLELETFDACFAGPQARARVAQDIVLAERVGLSGTPTFFINGYGQTGALPAPIFAALIEALEARGSLQVP